ncbi:peptidoglycan-binding domain-containing protein [Nitrogeniibacter aestuarii]|uniref:peptidoglycan-binding domain-containing protein n=1 Tax=Nitrogeniibacter aestuarii TaxID=2815343 RepID=UPI001D118FA7|nr:peptidoglycan-binding domain-containing protein [Nitrogeniibacter aestuarii]
MSLKTCLLLLGIGLSLPAAAADGKDQFAVRGASLIDCAVFSREHAARADVSKIVASWVDGYVSGINQATPDTYDILSFETTELILEIVDRHCREHPTDRVFSVVHKLFEQLKADRIKARADKILIEQDGRDAQHYTELIQRVQRKLKAAGLYQGKADGQYSPALSSGIAKYQTSIGFEPTGFPDQATLWRLLRSK